MTVFWMVAILLVLIAMLFIMWPLIKASQIKTIVTRKKTNIIIFEDHLSELDHALTQGDIDQQQYDVQKKELENTLWDDVQINDTPFSCQSGKKWLWVLAVIIPLCAFGLYGVWGSYFEVMLSKTLEHSVMATSDSDRDAAHTEVISLLEKQTRGEPNNFDNWYLLGEFYIQTKMYPKAADAFGHAVSIKSDDPDALAQYAQALYFSGNNKLTFAVTSTAEQALKINPDQPTALGLLGIAAFENKHYREAIGYWQKILWIVGEQDAGATSLKNGIAFTKSILQKQGEWAFINVEVKIDSTLVVTPSQWIFVYAREPNTRKPVAIVKMKASELPPTVVLDDTTTMPNGALLSSIAKVEVVVRLSETGSAQPSETDKEVISHVISSSVKGKNIKLLLK